ncbi:MAG: pyridoxamine kinase [Clostridia bacterium]|nr:pyridoxamine kinase [Clostridia bacterium]
MKRIVTIQDISCFGKCSVTVALPIISAMGIECAILPTSILSTHTGGFEGFTFRDLSDDIPKISEHWKKYDLSFDTIYTGYLGSVKQIDYTLDFIDSFKGDGTLVFVDPAMADKGKMYTGFDMSFPAHMARLCAKADIIVPNVTEASFLTNTPYTESYDEAHIRELLKKLTGLGAKKAVITGIAFEKSTQGAYFYDSDTEEYYYYKAENIDRNFHGTGDTFASAFVGAVTKGFTLKQALEIAVNFTVECIKATLPDAENHKYGVKFEECIPSLIEKIK